jgi:hypothetical protein
MNVFLKIFFWFWIVWILWYLTGGPLRDTSKPFIGPDKTGALIETDTSIYKK